MTINEGIFLAKQELHEILIRLKKSFYILLAEVKSSISSIDIYHGTKLVERFIHGKALLFTP